MFIQCGQKKVLQWCKVFWCLFWLLCEVKLQSPTMHRYCCGISFDNTWATILLLILLWRFTGLSGGGGHVGLYTCFPVVVVSWCALCRGVTLIMTSFSVGHKGALICSYTNSDIFSVWLLLPLTLGLPIILSLWIFRRKYQACVVHLVGVRYSKIFFIIWD